MGRFSLGKLTPPFVFFWKLNDSGRVHIWNPSETLITEIPHRWVDVDSERSLAVVLLQWGRGKLRKTSIWKDLEIPFINWLRGRALVPKSSQMSVHNWNQPTLQDPKLFIDFHPKINITFQTLHFPHFPRCTLYSTHTPKTFPSVLVHHKKPWNITNFGFKTCALHRSFRKSLAKSVPELRMSCPIYLGEQENYSSSPPDSDLDVFY